MNQKLAIFNLILWKDFQKFLKGGTQNEKNTKHKSGPRKEVL